MPDDGTVTLLKTGEARGSADGSLLHTLYYDILAGGKRVGTCELRPDTAWAARWSGQVSYTVFPPYRGHHYALAALRLLCAEAGKRGLDRLIVTCRLENAASRRTLELAGAELVEVADVPKDHPLIQSKIYQVCVYHLQTTRRS